jgi:flagellin
MSSLLTNNSAMVALQTLKGINKDLAAVQDQVSTGKRISNAWDNAALWGISTTMKTDVSGFKAISESLSLGSATLSVARDASETIADLLDQMKGKIVAAQEENVDRNKIQADVDALRDQIRSVRGAAQFNGLNLIDNADKVNILSSLDRDANGNVKSSSIEIQGQDLTETAHAKGNLTDLDGEIAVSSGATASNAGTTTAIAVNFAAGNVSFTIDGVSFNVVADTDNATTATAIGSAIAAAGIDGITAVGNGANVDITNTREFEDVAMTWTSSAGTFTLGGVQNGTTSLTSAASVVTLTPGTINEGDSYAVGFDAVNYTYTAKAGDTASDIALGLKTVIDTQLANDNVTTVSTTDSAGNAVVKIYNDSATGIALTDTGSSGGAAGGGLFGLNEIDVTSSAKAKKALGAIEYFIQSSISAAAEFGSSQGRIQTQSEFVSKVMDGLTSGIGALVDADMEEASARLQALQVQQQLGIQALSIANQAPQNILALFR